MWFMFNFKKSIFFLLVLIFTFDLFPNESDSKLTTTDEDNYQNSLFYIGLGEADDSGILSEEPWSVGIIIRDEDSIIGFDIGGEGIKI